ncbi:N-acyl-D-amino-acid deacylase family protein [Trujillonella endophytica]|uniref:N-acyl-D-aspartate/D-glutamate deacylase n=1 Tax=Trujillonella endophytica TaxID=673521 RepID=A0A1H8Q3M0_9ACTN|nr:amidohydrolase family protein [Trujillella endophytica]SEO48628.1 N-acyl-D-aspartate/D-glutamate deacylase [Trujillella endophytica]
MEIRLLIKGGTVVDGTGAPAFAADVRVAEGRITEVGPDLAAGVGERVVDASGCYVTPGMIETHNHWDGGVWWSPNMEPLPAYGITTSINGNCGFSMAPAPQSPEAQQGLIDMFNFFEDIPEAPMRNLVPWDWSTWSEYKDSVVRHIKLPVNFAAFIGHQPLRLYVMGQEAWERAATPAEIERMCEVLEDALSAGAMGLASNQLDHDKYERPLPSQQADDAEYRALMEVIGRHEGATLQVIVDHFMRMTGPAQAERFGRLSKETGVRVQWAGVPTLTFQAEVGKKSLELHEQFKAEGVDAWTGYHHVSPTSVINFVSSLVFAQNGNPVWQEVINARTWEEKSAMLLDEGWLERARKGWDETYSHSLLHDPSALTFLDSETGWGPIDCTLADYIAQGGFAHPSDALADWVFKNGAESVVHKRSWQRDEELLMRLVRDPQTVGNLSDGGAHGKMFCGTGDNIWLLTEYVRDRGMLTIEEGIHALTGKLANFFSLRERGEIREGFAADIAVFALEEIERRKEVKIWDVPDGTGGRTYRYTRDAAPMRLTLANGVPTFDNGVFTGRFAGDFVGPGATQPTVMGAR